MVGCRGSERGPLARHCRSKAVPARADQGKGDSESTGSEGETEGVVERGTGKERAGRGSRGEEGGRKGGMGWRGSGAEVRGGEKCKGMRTEKEWGGK